MWIATILVHSYIFIVWNISHLGQLFCKFSHFLHVVLQLIVGYYLLVYILAPLVIYLVTLVIIFCSSVCSWKWIRVFTQRSFLETWTYIVIIREFISFLFISSHDLTCLLSLRNLGTTLFACISFSLVLFEVSWWYKSSVSLLDGCS